MRKLAWMLAAALLAFLCLWPLYAGVVSAADDLKFIRGAGVGDSIAENLQSAWKLSRSFRPLEIVVAAGCDKQTLACRAVVPVQISGLLVLAAGLVLLMRRIAPEHPIAAPLLLIWMALSPATTVSLWQMDTCSQTWAAAMAVWGGLMTWRAIDAAREGRVDWARWFGLLVLFAIALNVKETFYGWSAGIGTALVLTLVSLWRSDPAAARRASLLLFPVVLLPILHLGIRWMFSGLSGNGSEDERYSVTLGENLLVNGGVSLAGIFANGPLHLLADDAALPLLRLLSLASMLASLCVVAAALAILLLHRAAPPAVRIKPLLLSAGAAILSLAVTLPMGSVSELYGFGANIGSGLLVVCALISLWNAVADDERLICRVIAGIGAATLLLVGGYGLASRAYHFDITWTYARTLNDLVRRHQRSLPSESITPRAIVFLNPDCLGGRLHSTYVVNPTLAFGAFETMDWLNRTDPLRTMTLSNDRPTHPRPGIDLVVDCQSLPQRAHW